MGAPSAAAPSAQHGADLLNVTDGGYVLLAACQPEQTAKQVLVDRRPRGALSLHALAAAWAPPP